MGVISKISGPLVVAKNMKDTRMHNVVLVGDKRLLGEVIQMEKGNAFIQVYESTDGLVPGEPLEDTGRPLVAELGPGLLGSIFDGIQRPLPKLRKNSDFILRGISVNSLDKEKKWTFHPLVSEGDTVQSGTSLGFVKEFDLEHQILVPSGVSGKIEGLNSGPFRVSDIVATVGGANITLMQKWPVRMPRPVTDRISFTKKFITGIRAIDSLFPIMKGGSIAVSGGFGVGKTVILQSIAKFSDADVVVYVGCGERGNEMADLLHEFDKLKKKGRPLSDRTVLIANTSNMPVTARESSIYLGATIGEYYRDMGYASTIISDSTSRWAEALREINSRLGEMPGEQGYPANLSSRISAFYERSGSVITLGGENSSMTLLGAVSPPGGDFSEPVTQSTLKVVRTFLALDKKLADKRHFPSVSWTASYSLNVSKDELSSWALMVLNRETELEEIVQLVGPDSLQEKEKVTLMVGQLIRLGFLQQNALSKDAFSSSKKSFKILRAIKKFSEHATTALNLGDSADDLKKSPAFYKLINLKETSDFEEELNSIMEALS